MANKRKKLQTDDKDTKYKKVPRLEMVTYYKHCPGCGTVQQPWLLREKYHFSTIDPSWRWSSFFRSFWHCTDSVSLYEIIAGGNVHYLSVWHGLIDFCWWLVTVVSYNANTMLHLLFFLVSPLFFPQQNKVNSTKGLQSWVYCEYLFWQPWHKKKSTFLLKIYNLIFKKQVW